MSKIAVCGVSGRMGQRLAHLTLEAEDLELVGGTECAGHASIGSDIGQVIGAPQLGIEVVDSLRSCAADADVVIAFTTPATLDVYLCGDGRADGRRHDGIYRDQLRFSGVGLGASLRICFKF